MSFPSAVSISGLTSESAEETLSLRKGDSVLWGIEAREYCGHAAKTLRQVGEIVKAFRCYLIPEDVQSSGCHDYWMIEINDSWVMHHEGFTECCSEVITDREDCLADGVV